MRRSNYFAIAAGLVIAMPAYAQTTGPFTVAQTKLPTAPAPKTTTEFPAGTSDTGGVGTNTEAVPTPYPPKTTTTTAPKTTTTTAPK